MQSVAIDKLTGYSYIKGDKNQAEKSFFYNAPVQCNELKCPHKRKAYLVSGDFVLVSHSTQDFYCVKFLGPKPVVGWILKKNIEQIKTQSLTKKDLDGTWWQIPCGDNDDCMLSFSKSEKNEVEITLMEHFNKRPGALFNIESTQETQTGYILQGNSYDKKQKLVIRFTGKDLPPGMLKVEGDDEGFPGFYYKQHN